MLGRRAGLEAGPAAPLRAGDCPGRRVRLRAVHRRLVRGRAGAVGRRSAVGRRHAVDGGDAAAAAAREMLRAEAQRSPAPSTPCPPTTATWSSPASAASARSSARILTAKRIPFTALEFQSRAGRVRAQVRRQASTTATPAGREILEAAQTGKARAFVLAIDDVEASLRTAQMVRQHYPHVPIYARARDRRHTHQLMDVGVTAIRRETFLSSLELTRELLRGLGLSEREVRFAVDTFQAHDRAQALRGLPALHRRGEAAGSARAARRRSWKTCSPRTRPNRPKPKPIRNRRCREALWRPRYCGVMYLSAAPETAPPTTHGIPIST